MIFMNTTISKGCSIALLITRIIIGGLFIFSGWMKVSDMAMTLGMFQGMGIPDFLTYIVSYGEIIGGLLLVLGLWITVVGAFLGIIMVSATYLSIPLGFPMYLIPAVVFVVLLFIIKYGAGAYRVKFSRA